MSEGEEKDTSRATVKTYIPAYQKAEWKRHADELDMTQSEFVRSMVQAGRNNLSIEPMEPDSPDANPGGDDLEDRVQMLLVDHDHLSWQELADELAGDFEDRLEDALSSLQSQNVVQYSGRHDGYRLLEE